ncbi:MAG: precorrin-3B C(17)-methyltransferase [Dissulfurispiraceae bacterium]
MATGSDSVLIFYITKNGFGIAEKVKALYSEATILKFNPASVSDFWSDAGCLIFIMATGIVVRTVAPFLKDKKTDPAVIVLDENGRFAISLLSGHIGGANQATREIAQFLDAEAVITTASDIKGLPAIDLWAQKNNLAIEDWSMVPHVSARLLNEGVLNVYTEIEIDLPDAFIRTVNPGNADVFISNKERLNNGKEDAKAQLYLRPKNLVVGMGCNSGTNEKEIEDCVRKTLSQYNLSFSSIHSLATIEKKASEPGLIAFAEKFGIDISTFTPGQLNSIEGLDRSETVYKATGAHAVAEPAALLAAGTSRLLIPKQKIGNNTIAAAEMPRIRRKGQAENKTEGKIYIVGTGPGSIDHITPCAQKAIKVSDVVVGYSTYLDLIPQLIKGKEIISTGMTREIDRCRKAIGLAVKGKTVAVISGGDPGIYAMAGLVFELLRAEETKNNDTGGKDAHTSGSAGALSVEVIPGISALNACAAKLGAPLMHDFASISLSDRLTPWELIEKRLTAAASADFVIVLFNPKSKGRVEQIQRATDILRQYRKRDTPVGIIKGAMREGERIIITDLNHMLQHEIDMQTTILIGNSQTFLWHNRMVTPRGYGTEYKD